MHTRAVLWLFVVVFSLLNLSAIAQVSMRLVIDAPFCLYAEEGHSDIKTEPIASCMLPKGTTVEVLGRSWDYHFVQVSLSDGSLGYVPTIAFAFNEVSLKPKNAFTGLREGETYKLHSISSWEGIKPRAMTFRGANGRLYKFANNSQGIREFEYQNAYQSIQYGEFFERYALPYYMEDRDDTVLRLSLKNGELPMTLIGCSKSYIDEVLTSPLGYAGPSVSEYNGYVYAFYENVIWPEFEIRDDLWGAGMIIFYDYDLTAVYMKKMPWTFDFEPDYTKLRTPKQAVKEVAATIADDIEKSKRRSKYKAAEPLVEKYAAPDGVTSTLIDMMYIFENKLGINNRWAILGILIAALLVIQLLAYILVRKFYRGPNKYIGLVAFLIVLPFMVYAMIYVARFYIIVAILAFICIFSFSLYASIFLTIDADEKRCNKCRSWLGSLQFEFASSGVVQTSLFSNGKKSAIIVSSQSPNPSTSEPKIKLGWGAFMDRSESNAIKDGVAHTYYTRAWNYKTEVEITWTYRMMLKCPKCGYMWEYSTTQTEQVPGPIQFVVYEDDTSRWVDRTTTRIIRKSDGTVVHEDTEEKNRSNTSSRVRYRKTDVDRYNIYLRRYINGDKGALREYENTYFGEYWGQ